MISHTSTLSCRWNIYLFFTALFIVLISQNTLAYTVTNLNAVYQNGQVFLTWTNPNVTKLQYNIYRSNTPFTSSSQLSSSTFLGFVRDSSSKNIRLSQISQAPVFFQITNGGTPLLSSQGLYVVTCTDNNSHFYAVTVTQLSNGTEDKTISTGQNSLATGVNELTSKPQPVFQFSETWKDDEVVDRYVEFGNNQDTPLYPAMNSTGSYGFNFYVLKRGSAVSFPLILMEEGVAETSVKGNGLDEFEDQTITNCYIMSVDDWLPIPKPNGDVGDNTYFCCYHEDFNIYEGTNPIPADGIVKLYPQHRYIEALRWAKTHLPIDTTKVYTVGNSAGGFGAELTAAIIPEEIAAVYSIVDPTSIGTNGSDLYKSMWGTSGNNLATDIPDWRTGDAIHFNELTDMKLMLDVNEQRDIPLIFDIHGKHDHTVGWNDKKIAWLDSLQSNHAGGIFYWDGREHTGDGQDFLDTETTPDFFRYSTKTSFPAFSNCSINQDPGNGNASNGDPIGTINGYLGWSDDIADHDCNYTVNVFVKDLYQGGVLFPDQYTTCTTDISFRRIQKFQPVIGSTIKWKNLDANGVKIQHGSFTYNGGLITLAGMTVNKTGNTIKLQIKNCSQKIGDAEEDDMDDDLIYFSKSPNGYIAHADVFENASCEVIIYDLLGRLASEKKVQLMAGLNSIAIPSPGSGIFVVQIKCDSFSQTEKLFF